MGQTKSKSPERQVRASVDMPESLWRAVRMRAMDERTNLRAVMLAAVTAYLKTPVRPKGGAS